MNVLTATRQAYGEALVELGAEEPRLVVLDADLSNSTGTAKFAKAFPERFFNMGIAEQNMISVAAGLAASGYLPFASSFAMFATGRAWEQVRNSIVHNQFNVKVAATHAGITLGQDGASHQAIEDVALMSAIPTMTVVAPADTLETKALVRALLHYPRPAYLRLGRHPVPLVFGEQKVDFQIGKAQILRPGGDVTIAAYGVMSSIALQAAELLAVSGVQAEVINLSTLKPLDGETLLSSLEKTGCLVVAEEHNRLGGVNQVIAALIGQHCPHFCPLEVVAIEDRFGQSGTAEELLQEYGLTKEHLAQKAQQAISRKQPN